MLSFLFFSYATFVFVRLHEVTAKRGGAYLNIKLEGNLVCVSDIIYFYSGACLHIFVHI